MKALPVKLVQGQGYTPCEIADATHVTLNIPGPTGKLTLPVIRSGTREGTGCWTWNGSTDTPTLRPSVLTEGHNFRCHSWINDGAVQFLDDCSHEFKGQTLPLLDAASPVHSKEYAELPDWDTIQEIIYPHTPGTQHASIYEAMRVFADATYELRERNKS